MSLIVNCIIYLCFSTPNQYLLWVKKKIKNIIFLIICLKTMTILYINLIYVLFSTDHVENLSTTGIKIQKAKYR